MKPKHPASIKFLKSGLFDDLNSFPELEHRIMELPMEKERGDALEVFTEALFATQKKYQAKEIWPDTAIPPQIAKKLLLPVKDMGVDGVLEDHSGNLITYQVKFRSNRPALTWGELGTFFGLSEKADHRMVITNCNDLADIVKHRPNFSSVRGNTLDHMEPRDFQAIRSWLSSGHVERERKTPWRYQKEAIRDICKELGRTDRTTAVMACGSGKTLVSVWVAEAENPKNVLVLLPSLALVNQIFNDWSSETSWENIAYRCVCSDLSVGRGADSLMFDQTDLDFRVTTDSIEVADFLHREHDGVRVIFSTYQSSKVVAEGMPKGFKFDLGIFDEAHKTTGRGSNFTFALEDKNLPIRKRLFLTATPRHYNIYRRTKDGDASLVYSMDAEDVYGSRAHTLTFGKAVEKDIICDYKVLISVVNDEMVNAFARSHGEVNVNGDIVKAQQVANQIALAKAVEDFNVKRIITFHRTVNSAKSFASDGAEGISTHLPDFDSAWVSGAMPTSRRESFMKTFKSVPKAIMSNARCLTEGVDVPSVDMVAFMSPKKSKVDIVQATGRAMRKNPKDKSKKYGYVLVPLYLEEHTEEDLERALERTDFEEVWNVLQAMQEQDEELADIIRQLREDRGRTKGFDDSRLREKVETLGPQILLEQIRRAVTTKLIDKLGVSWDERFGELLAYREEYGDCNVPRFFKPRPGLGDWCSNMRMAIKNNSLSKERHNRLKSIGFDIDPLETKWKKMYQSLVDYKKEHGDCDVPKSGFLELSLWCSRQRMAIRDGQLNQEKIELLKAIGFDLDPIETQWKKKYQSLVEYKKEHGDCAITNKSETYRDLWNWCSHQRAAMKKGNLSQEKIELFEAIGFDLKPYQTKWKQMYQSLVDYKKEYGDCDVPWKFALDPELWNWCSRQRTAIKNGKLSQEKISLLKSIGFDFKPSESKWKQMYQSLVDYKKEHGDCNVSNKIDLYRELRRWCSTQRKNIKDGKLNQEKIELLKSIGFDLDPVETQWKQMCQSLVAYKKEHGDCDVPTKIDIYRELGGWCSRQRTAIKNGKLSQEQIELLKSIGFDIDPLATKWKQMYQFLVAYKKEHGDCDVPQKSKQYPELGRWCSFQRKGKKKGKLSKERIKRLESIDFKWSLR